MSTPPPLAAQVAEANAALDEIVGRVHRDGVEKLLTLWLQTSIPIERAAAAVERAGGSVEGAELLRRNLRDVTAALDPDDEPLGGLRRLRGDSPS